MINSSRTIPYAVLQSMGWLPPRLPMTRPWNDGIAVGHLMERAGWQLEPPRRGRGVHLVGWSLHSSARWMWSCSSNGDHPAP